MVIILEKTLVLTDCIHINLPNNLGLPLIHTCNPLHVVESLLFVIYDTPWTRVTAGVHIFLMSVIYSKGRC